MIRITDALREARLTATRDTIDAGAGHGTIEMYDINQPATLGAAPSGPPCAVVTLAKPCGTVGGGYLTLAQADSGGDMIATTSGPLGVAWALVRDGDGNIVMDGTVSDNSPGATGDIKLAGSSGTQVFAGGYVLLGDFRLR